MKLTRIFSRYLNGKYNIYLFGYDKGLYVNLIVKFKDYFFYLCVNIDDLTIVAQYIQVDESRKYKSMYGKLMYKVQYSDIRVKKTIASIEGMFNKSCSLDIKPLVKYILDNKLLWSPKRNIMFFDIETKYNQLFPHLNQPDWAQEPVTSIQTFSTEDKLFYIITWHPSLKIKDKKNGIDILKKDNVNYLFCIDLTTVLTTFIALVKLKNIDCLSGWYSSQYDLPYIINRCNVIGIDINALSPANYVYNYKKEKRNEWTNGIAGIDHLDMMDCFKNLDIKLSNNKLDTAAKEILEDEDLGKMKTASFKDWLDNFLEFLKYGIRDVEILNDINLKIDVMGTFIAIQIASNVPTLSQVFAKTNTAENMLFKLFWDLVVFPNKREYLKLAYMGAFVAEVTPGLYKNVALLDFASLYPTTITAYNLSPETFITSYTTALLKNLDIDKDIIPKLLAKGISYVDTGYSDLLFGKRYIFLSQNSKEGLFAKMLSRLFKERQQIKKRLSILKLGSFEYTTLVKKSYALKIVMNGTYGAFGSPYYRFYMPLIADSVTFFSRKAIHTVFEYFELKYKLRAVYGDTDSTFCKSLIRTRVDNIFMEDLFDRSKYLDTINNRLFRINDHDLLLYYDLDTKEVKYGKINLIERHKVNKKMYKVILLSGNFTIITEDHSLIIEENNKLITKKTKDLKKNDLALYLLSLGDTSISLDKENIEQCQNVKYVELNIEL